jgi:hypothetical protein
VTPKEWAKANGYDVKAGRGRMPRHITEAYRAAMAGKVTDSTPKSVQPVKPKPEFVEPAAPLRPLTSIVYAWIDGKKVIGSMRAACFWCHASLCWCPCENPKAIVSNTSGYVPVTIE